MDVQKVYHQALLKDELVYEVGIRDEIPEDTVAKLRKQLHSISRDFSPGDVLDEESDPDTEFPVITEKTEELQSRVDEYEKSRDRYSLTRARALYVHLHHRLRRLVCKVDIDSERKQVLLSVLNVYFATLSKYNNGQEDNPSSDIPLVQVEQTSQNTSCLNIQKWNIKFNGQSSPHSFLESVQERAEAFSVSDSTLFKSAFCLFSDQGLVWYRGVKEQVHSWKELSDLLLVEFAPTDFDYRLLGEIRARTQGLDEPTHIYFAVMSSMFSRLKQKLSDQDKLEILLHNIRPSFNEHLALHDINTVSELKDKCRKIESARKMTNDFSEPPKQLNCCPEYVCKGRQVQKPVVAPIFVQKPNENQHANTSNQNQKKTGNQSQGYKNRVNSGKMNSRFGEQNGKQNNVDKNIKLFCHKCKVDTHATKQCKDKRIMCFTCGEIGFFTRACPKCKQNGQSKN